jgi:hypothetical protein
VAPLGVLEQDGGVDRGGQMRRQRLGPAAGARDAGQALGEFHEFVARHDDAAGHANVTRRCF